MTENCLRRGAELDTKDIGGQMPLSWAAVKLLLEKGAEGAGRISGMMLWVTAGEAFGWSAVQPQRLVQEKVSTMGRHLHCGGEEYSRFSSD